MPELDAACGRILRAAQSERRLPSLTGAVWRRGEELWADAVGVADVERGEEATPDHQHRIASITKTFTAVSVLQLRDAGALDLDDRVDRHVPGLPQSPTLRRLLSHAGGIQRENPGSDWEREDGLPSAAEVVERLADVEQVLPEGDEWHYSNLGFVLLGEVVERVAGMPYERYRRGAPARTARARANQLGARAGRRRPATSCSRTRTGRSCSRSSAARPPRAGSGARSATSAAGARSSAIPSQAS